MRTIFGITAVLCTFPVAFAQSIDIPYQSFTLDNGLEVLVHEDHSDAVVAVYVSYHVGSGREVQGKSGFAHLFEHMLFQGSQNVGDDMHFKYVSEAGGTLNGTTNTDRTVYFETLPSNQLEVALWLESDRMGFLLPALTDKSLANQIDVVKNERRQNYENPPYGQDPGAIVAALYPKDHPYSWLTIGSHEDLTSASLADVKGFFSRWYGPNNATLVVAGDVNPNEVRVLAERYFGPITRGPAVDRPAPRPVKLDAVQRLVREDRVRLPQLTLSWPTAAAGSDDEAALDTLAQVLGANKAALLTKALTIDEQLASSVQVGSDTQELAGTFDITLRAQPGVSLDALEARMQQVLADLIQSGVDPAALEREKQRYASDFVRRLETVSTRASILAASNTLRGRPDAYKETHDRRMDVKPADVTRVLKQYVFGRNAVALSTVPNGKREMAAKETPFPQPIADEIVAIDRSKKPAPGRTPPFHAPVVWHDTTDKGVPIAGVAWNERPLSTLTVAVPAGRIHETPEKLGLSSLTASMLGQGTETLDAIGWVRELDALGATIQSSADEDEISITLTCLDAKFPDAVKLFVDVITKPRFDATDFARLKKERTTALETRGEQIRIVATDVYRRLLYGDQSVLGRSSIGTKASVASFTLDDVKNYWHTFGVPGGARIAYVGSLDGRAVKLALAPLSTVWTGSAPPTVARTTPPRIAKTQVYLVDKPGAAQSEIRIGHMGPSSRDTDFYGLSLVNWSLGGSFSSRVNLNLREDKGYTYGARTAFEGGSTEAPFVASAGVKTDVTAESVAEFMKELSHIVEGVSADELVFTKDSLGMGARRQYEATGALVGLLDNVMKFGFADDYPVRRLAELDAATIEHLNALAKKWIHPEAMVILVVGDKAKVGAKLAGLGYGAVIELDTEGERVGRN